MGFRDRTLEADFWADVAKERGPLIRNAIAILIVMCTAFAAVDFIVFREHLATLVPLRVGMVLGLLVITPIVWGKRSDAILAKHGQHLLAYLTVVSAGVLLAMGFIIYPRLTSEQRFVALISSLFALLCIYCLSGLRFLYATAAGLTGSLALCVLAATNAIDRTDQLVGAAFLGGENLVGLAVAWSLERSARRDFVQRMLLSQARDRTDALLLNLMPATFAERLKERDGDALERLDDASVLFATVTGFTDATRDKKPLEAVLLLDRIVSRLDRICAEHGVERIKTVGATIMCAAGIGAARGRSAGAAVRCAVAMRDAVRGLGEENGLDLALRVGVATGPLVVGVIGRSRLAFDCWGDTANLASRLDTHGEAGRVHVAEETAHAVAGEIATTPRGKVRLKGKGEVSTHWIDA